MTAKMFTYDLDLHPQDFQRICHLIKSAAGINLSAAKQTMVVSRLRRRLTLLGISSFEDYLQYLEDHSEELMHFINTLTTNKTDFFRESDHFSFLVSSTLPKISALTNNDFSIWSAASSTGEEIYTLAMVLEKYTAELGGRYRILGTDIDTECLGVAGTGEYPIRLLEAIPPEYRQGCVERGKGANADKFRFSSRIRKNVKFRQFNLIADSLPEKLRFDVIFLRNVLIYFDLETTKHVVNRLANFLKPHGYLFIGHSENLSGFKHPFESVGNSIYVKKSNE